MTHLFKIIQLEQGEGEPRTRLCVGVEVKLGDQQSVACPVSRGCGSYGAWTQEIEGIKADLDRILDEGRGFFEGAQSGTSLSITADMAPEEIWEILSTIGEEEMFVRAFNQLEDSIRKRVAEYVLTQCNVFSGRGSVFSARYNNETGRME